jgi:PAS domain-containing protein
MGTARQREEAQEMIPRRTAFDQAVEQALLRLHAAAVMVVSGEMEILQCHGDFSRTLGATASPTSKAGEPIRRLVNLTRRSGALHEEVVAIEGRSVRIAVFPAGHVSRAPAFVVVLEPAGTAAQNVPGPSAAELLATRNSLEAVIQDYETNTEELRAAHEELRTANEELLRANEDLENSRATLQELNRDLLESNRKLGAASEDLANMLEGIGLPILILDGELRVHRVNRQGRELFNLLPSDVGRPVSDLRPRLSIPDLTSICRSVLKDLTPRVERLLDGEDRPAILSIRPYRSGDDLVGLVVLRIPALENVSNPPADR